IAEWVEAISIHAVRYYLQLRKLETWMLCADALDRRGNLTPPILSEQDIARHAMKPLHNFRSDGAGFNRRINDDLRLGRSLAQCFQVRNLKRNIVKKKDDCGFDLFDQRHDLIVSIDALPLRRLVKLPRIIVRPAVVSRSQLMQFKIIM